MAEDAARYLGGVVHRIEPVTDGTRPLHVPGETIPVPPQTDDFTADAKASMEALTDQSLGGVDDSETRKKLLDACQLKDGAEAWSHDTLEAQAESLLTSHEGNATFKNRVADLSKEMAQAENFGDATEKAAVFGLCEWVGTAEVMTITTEPQSMYHVRQR